MSEFVFPEKVLRIIDKLERSGYEAYAVGGCVRDTLMDRVPHDWDITTSALPLQIKQVFPRTVDTGIAHGTVTVLMDGEAFEVTTYRIDGTYDDHRHPAEVTFTPSLEEDLKRRDFTVNAMACNPRRGLVDLYGGREDIDRRVIRCVGEAHERFTEDALRIMRAVRFAAMLDFSIAEETAQAARALADNLRYVSAERISMELIRLLTSPHPERIEEARRLSITKIILPEYDEIVNQYAGYGEGGESSVGAHTVRALQLVRPDKVLRLTMLLHDMGKPAAAVYDESGAVSFPGHAAQGALLAGKIMRRLKLDRKTMDSAEVLIREHTGMPPAEEAALRHMISRMGPAYFPLYLEVKEADILSGNPAKRESRLRQLSLAQAAWTGIRERGDPLAIHDLAVTGRDLMGIGIPGGPGLGKILQSLLDEVLDAPAHNTRDYLLAHADQLYHEKAE